MSEPSIETSVVRKIFDWLLEKVKTSSTDKKFWVGVILGFIFGWIVF